MYKNYPLIHGYRRKPNRNNDGMMNYGKPCVVCGEGTIGEKWVQVSCMRGEDETARVCAEHWNFSDEDILNAWEGSED